MALKQNEIQNQSQSGLAFAWWRLRIKNGVKDADEKELEGGVETCEAIEVAFAGLVIAGIFFEFFVAFSHPPYDSVRGVWWPIIGDAFVSIGLIVEIFASLRGKSLQSELTRRSNERLTDATWMAEVANARAAEATTLAAESTERAAAAKLEAARLLAHLSPRVVTNEQLERIKTLRGKVTAIQLVSMADPECALFGTMLAMAFQEAGAATTEFQIPPHVVGHGVGLYVPRSGDAKELMPGGKDLIEALTFSGILTGGVHLRLPQFGALRSDIPAILVFARIPLPFPTAPFFGGPPSSKPATISTPRE